MAIYQIIMISIANCDDIIQSVIKLNIIGDICSNEFLHDSYSGSLMFSLTGAWSLQCVAI